MNLLWILLFGSIAPIVETPVDLIAGANEIPLQKPISAVTSDATLQVDISALIPRDELTLDLSRKWVEKNIEPGCLKAALKGQGGASVGLDFIDASSFEPGKTFLILSNQADIPVFEEFGSLTLTSCKPLKRVALYWKNYQK